MKQKDVVNLILGSVSTSKHEQFLDTYYNCQIKWDGVYRKEPFILFPQKVIAFDWKCINNCVMTEKMLCKMNKFDGLFKLCECDTEDLIR